MFHYRVYKKQPLVCILSRINPVYAVPNTSVQRPSRTFLSYCLSVQTSIFITLFSYAQVPNAPSFSLPDYILLLLLLLLHHYNPGWVLAFSTSLFHSFLFLVNSFQFFTLSTCISLRIPSIHLFLGLSAGLFRLHYLHNVWSPVKVMKL